MFPYHNTFLPPAPALEVEVRNPHTGAAQILLAKLDTGADGTLIPEDLVQTLGLLSHDRFLAVAFDMQAKFIPSYLIDLTVAGWVFTQLEVPTAPLPYILIGRDVLNQLVITLDGPQLTFDIT
jgi:predicted aspartyl protease